MGITKTHSRPHVSNDNPFSEAQFRTMKYCPQFPGNFGCIEDARLFCREFFQCYNSCHRHTGIGLMTPEHVHYGMVDHIFKERSATLKVAFDKNPNRFKNKQPCPPKIPTDVWINKPHPLPIVEDQRKWGMAGTESPKNGVEDISRQSGQDAEKLKDRSSIFRL